MDRSLLKIVALVLVSVLLISLVGCNVAKEEPAPANPSPGAENDRTKEPITVSYFLWEQSWNMPTEDSYVGTQIFDATGVKIEWIYPPTNPQEKLNAFLASGEFPDIIEIEDTSILSNYIAAGALLPLNDLVETKAPNLMKNLGSLYDKMKKEDGDLYTLPKWFRADGRTDFPEQENGHDIFARTGVMGDMGWKKPETFDEFEAMLQYTADNTDMIPLMLPLAQEDYASALYDQLGGAVGIKHFGEYMIDESNKIDHILFNEGFRKGLKYLNNWYLEGLLSPESITMKTDLLEEKVLAGEVQSSFYYGGYPDYAELTDNLTAEGKDPEVLIALTPKLDGSVERMTYCPYAVSYPTGYSISSTSPYADRIIEMIDALNSRDGLIMVQGKVDVGGNKDSEGYDMFIDDNGVYGITDWLTDAMDADEDYVSKEGLWFFDRFSPNTCIWPTAPDINMTAVEEDVSVWRDDVTNEIYDKLGYGGLQFWPNRRETAIDVTDLAELVLDPNSDEYTKQIDIRDYISKTLPKLIVADSDEAFNSLYDEMLATIKDYGLDDLLNKYQELYDARMARLAVMN